MALTYTKFTCFKEVEAHYNNTTPLRGEQNIGKDIRPIGARRRKWERIVKVSPNCYALSEGWHFGCEVYWGHTGEAEPTLELMERYAPIVWRKKKDGTELVTLRNGLGEGQHNSRYQFLWRHTPRGLTFRNRNGKHFITTDGREYFLAKGRTYPRAEYKRLKERADANRWTKALADRAMLHDDNSALTFKNTDDGWVLVTGGKPVPTPPRKVINKTAKAKYKQHIDAFKEWAFTMGPLLPIGDYEYFHQQRRFVTEWMKENDYDNKRSWGSDMGDMDLTLRRQIISFETHPLRLPMAVYMLRSIEFHRATDEDDIRLIKQRANTWINNTMGFVKTV